MIPRSLGVVGVGFVLLLVQSTLYQLVPWERGAPDLVLPLLLAMGLSDTPLAWGSPIAFVIGYMADAFSGSPMGLQTIVAVGAFLLGHLASVRLFIQGIPFQVVLTFGASLLSSATILGLRLVFHRPDPTFGGWEAAGVPWLDLLLRAGVTAILAPFVFAIASGLVPRRAPETVAA